MNAEAGEQRAGGAVDPLRQTLIALAHFRQREDARHQRKPRESLQRYQHENAPTRAGADAVANKQ